jgi:hypothetical protein
MAGYMFYILSSMQCYIKPLVQLKHIPKSGEFPIRILQLSKHSKKIIKYKKAYITSCGRTEPWISTLICLKQLWNFEATLTKLETYREANQCIPTEVKTKVEPEIAEERDLDKDYKSCVITLLTELFWSS